MNGWRVIEHNLTGVIQEAFLTFFRNDETFGECLLSLGVKAERNNGLKLRVAVSCECHCGRIGLAVHYH